MADFDNLSALNENFDTIKTLLNSIRAQGILNTSDVDKLLTGIHSKLEKINTEEDIDLIKLFLSELKQNLDERHSVLVSKFGAIESLFSNLLKNSSEMPKSAELKELFDIVATNLSVFSREVVSQKESLTDITLRLDALRSDDSQKKDIIKNISLLRPDLERLNNGFDSIVISLNDNFKTMIKSISAMDNSDSLDKFSTALSGMEMSSNTILSALQVLDKKTEQVEDSIKTLATKEDVDSTKKKLFEISAQGHELSAVVTELSERYIRIDNLADKIDASVSIVAGLKSFLEESENNNARILLEEISKLEKQLYTITTDTKFEDFRVALEGLFIKISENIESIGNKNADLTKELKIIADFISTLDIGAGFQSVLSNITKSESEIKTYVNDNVSKSIDFQEANFSKVLKDIASNAEDLGLKLNQAQSVISGICEKNFGSVYAGLTDLKNVVAQIDENSVSANNAIFSSITDRLTVFENSLKVSLETQEKTVMQSSLQLTEQVENIKNLSNVLDYKMDSSVVEVSNVKREFGTLKSAIEEILALDFVTAVKDLRVDLYASKQELVNIVESTNSDLSNKFTDDIYGKYELLISKLDNVEDELKRTQASSLNGLKSLLENISASIVDVLSYVSEQKLSDGIGFDTKLNEISNLFKENNLDYVESVRDVVDVIRVQVENCIKNLEESSQIGFDSVKKSISQNSEDLKKEIKFSYSKLIEIQDSYKEIQELINVNSLNETNKFDDIITAAENIKSDFDVKLGSLKTLLLDKITDFKQDFTCENADKMSELKFSVENLYNKNSENVSGLISEIRDLLSDSMTENTNARVAALAKILDNFVSLKEILVSLNSKSAEDLADKINVILEDFANVKASLNKVDETIDEDFTRQLSIIESNFESLVSQISILFEKADRDLANKITNEFNKVSVNIEELIQNSLEEYKLKIEETVESLQSKAAIQSEYLQEKIAVLNKTMKSAWEEQASVNYQQIETFATDLKQFIDNNTEITRADYESMKSKLAEFAASVEAKNETLAIDLKAQIDDITKYLDSVLEVQNQEANSRFEELISQLNLASEGIITKTDVLKNSADEQLSLLQRNSNGISTLQQLQNDNIKKSEEIELHAKEHLELTKTANLEIAELNLIANDLGDKIDALDKQVQTQLELAKNSNAGVSILSQWGKEHSSAMLSGNSELKSLLNQNAEKLETTRTDVAALSFLSAEHGEKLDKLDESLKEQCSQLLLKTEGISNTVNEIEANLTTNNQTTTLIQAEVSNISDNLGIANESIKNLESSLTEKVINLKALTAEISAGELQALDSHVTNLSEQIELSKQNVKLCNDLLVELLKNELATITSNIEKETDIIVGELIEQFDLLKRAQNDNIVDLTGKLEEIINAHIYNNIEDLKSYLDIKTDNSVVTCKLDNLKNEMSSTFEHLLSNMNRLLDSDAFSSFISDFRVTNEVLLTSTVDKLNSKLESFISENLQTLSGELNNNNKKIEETLLLFDKKFVETVVDKYEEIKLLSNEYNSSLAEVKTSVSQILSDFSDVKMDTNVQIESLIQTLKETTDSTNSEIRKLAESFESLRSQISNKSFDEAFQASINKQIGSLESLVIQQLGYVEDINELCSTNLPDVAELNTLVKYSVLETLNKFSEKLDSQDLESVIESELKQTKSEIITQLINIFNQISFVAEQEEILDFIQEKHDELITILSHIVTTAEDVSIVKENVEIIDDKLTSVKNEISLLNEKINSIISSEGDVDYIYSLQDLESDLANLRLALKEIQTNNYSNEFSDLISSTNEIYSLVEAIKTELPNRKDFESMAEDLVSISTRTNKLILASDESYKTLQDNLQEFKHVVNDLDERTKNFAEDSGLNRIDNKLNSINSMMQSGAKTNQVFNQVFEYLAEWVDNAGVQINSISDKVETLDEISQIKTMIEDLKAESIENNSESTELVEALGVIFDKQAKRISSLETKLDKIIVETTINNQNNKMDFSPIEDTINKFLVAMDEKFTAQQRKIDALESILGNVLSLVDEKNTAQLTKKVGGMDRQIAKLNKSIEKIAAHVVEK